MVCASGFPAGGAKRRGSDVPFGSSRRGRRPPGRNLAVGRYCSGVSLMTPQVEWGARAQWGPGGQPPPGPLHRASSAVAQQSAQGLDAGAGKELAA